MYLYLLVYVKDMLESQTTVITVVSYGCSWELGKWGMEVGGRLSSIYLLSFLF